MYSFSINSIYFLLCFCIFFYWVVENPRLMKVAMSIGNKKIMHCLSGRIFRVANQKSWFHLSIIVNNETNTKISVSPCSCWKECMEASWQLLKNVSMMYYYSHYSVYTCKIRLNHMVWRGFIFDFGRRATGFHRQAKVNFIITKTFPLELLPLSITVCFIFPW